MGNREGAYRRGSERHNAPRLSNGSGGSAIDWDRTARQLREDARARATLEHALREHERNKPTFPAKSHVPKSAVNLARRAAGNALRRHPATSAVKAAVALLNGEGREQAWSYWSSVATLGGQRGSCISPDPLDYSDQRPGLPSTTCVTGQAVGPGYLANCNLGVGWWVKRAFAFNYNELWWQLPPAGQTFAECNFREKKAGLVDAEYPHPDFQHFAKPGFKLDPESTNTVDAPQVGTRQRPDDHPMIDPFAVPISANIPVAVALPVAVVTNREGRGPGVGEERSTWENGSAKPVTRTEPVLLPIAPQRPAVRYQRERKATAPVWLMRAIGMVTEELDAVAAVYPCIPKELRKEVEFKGRKRPVSLEEKARLIYKYWDEIHLGCAAFNLLWERIEDTAYATISQNSKIPFAKRGRRTVAGGRAFEFSRQGDADLPNGSLPLSDLKKWLQRQLGLEGQ